MACFALREANPQLLKIADADVRFHVNRDLLVSGQA